MRSTRDGHAAQSGRRHGLREQHHATLRNALNGKFYVIKPVEIDAPTLTYKNIGNVLLEQRNKVLAWIASHSSNADAVARYQVQLDLIDQALADLGLTESGHRPRRHADRLPCAATWTCCSSTCRTSTRRRARCSSTPTRSIRTSTSAANVLARSGAKIDILNNTPFTMNVNDAVIQDTKTVAIVNGQYTVLQPGNVYFNEANLTGVGANTSDKTISIVQKKVGA